MTRSDEKGIALVIALFMVLILSVIGSSLVFVSKTETLSSLNYKTMSQTRYAAESGVHSAANHLLWTYVPPAAMAGFDLATSPVQFNGADVVLSSDAGVPSNYPDAAAQNAFSAAAQGALTLDFNSVGYTSRATLLSMRQITDAITGIPATLQTWHITGTGRIGGAASAEMEVSAIVERQDTPLYKYAAFATATGCGALSFAGGATTDSYDSRNPLVAGAPVRAQNTGNVGTNGNLTEAGNPTTIWGSLSSPRTGVGECEEGSVNALEANGGASVEFGITELPQGLDFPTPPPIVPAPPLVSHSFGAGCPGGVLYCTAVAGGARFTPPTPTSVVQLGNVSLSAHQELRLNAGIYEINSITNTGHGEIIVESGPVIVRVAGDGVATPIDLAGGSVVNGTFVSSDLQFLYAGTGEVKLRGNSDFAAVVYAPNATTSFAGQGGFYGALITKKLTATGGADIHYDRALQAAGTTAGNPVLSSFTWRSF